MARKGKRKGAQRTRATNRKGVARATHASATSRASTVKAGVKETAKPTLTILLGAGSTVNLGVTPPKVPPIGMPSTDDLTKRIARMRFPAAVRRGTPILFGPDQEKPFHYNKQVPILPLIHRVLSSQFEYVDFELILHAVEQLEPIIASAEDGYKHDRYRAVLSAFVEVNRQLDLIDASLLLAVRPLIIAKIYRVMTGIPVPHLARPPALHRFIRNLEDQFQLAVFTLNYDDIVDGARESWFDGFTRLAEQSPGGRVWSANGFDARHFNNWREASEPLLVHLHGSVRFGYLRREFGTGKYSDSQAALESVEGTRVGDHYSAGQIVTASPIISGLSKPAKLVHNPEPFGYYYRAFIDSVLACERLLVIGYGARDDHINVWLDQYVKNHGKNRKVVWICKLPDSSVGEMTDEKQMITSLAGAGGFQEFRNYDDPGSAQNFQLCGALGLVPSGFPVSPQTEAEIVEFLRRG
jgi:SIR2-like domain